MKSAKTKQFVAINSLNGMYFNGPGEEGKTLWSETTPMFFGSRKKAKKIVPKRLHHLVAFCLVGIRFEEITRFDVQ